MRFSAVLIAMVITLPATGGCSAMAQWLSAMASWRTGEGHTRQEMVNEYNSETQSVEDMNYGY